MIRKQEEIDNDIKVLTGRLESKIEHGVAFEKQNDENIADLNRMLKLLVKEEAFENTLEGKIEALETDTIKAINILVEDLAKKTGKEYTINLINRSDENKTEMPWKSGLAGAIVGRAINPEVKRKMLNDFHSFVIRKSSYSGLPKTTVAHIIGKEIQRRGFI